MDIKQNIEKVLVLAPHTDDGELGAGGLISAFTNSGVDVYYTAFSSCAESVPDGFASDALIKECRTATSVLGIKKENVCIKNYRVRRFHESRQEILEELVESKKTLDPDLVLVPSRSDVHQDHSVITDEAVRAFKDRCLLGYELPWNCIEFKSTFVFELDEADLNNKLEAIRCYESQGSRGYGDGRSLKNLAELRGGQIGARYAEAFDVMRWVWRR